MKTFKFFSVPLFSLFSLLLRFPLKSYEVFDMKTSPHEVIFPSPMFSLVWNRKISSTIDCTLLIDISDVVLNAEKFIFDNEFDDLSRDESDGTPLAPVMHSNFE